MVNLTTTTATITNDLNSESEMQEEVGVCFRSSVLPSFDFS